MFYSISTCTTLKFIIIMCKIEFCTFDRLCSLIFSITSQLPRKCMLPLLLDCLCIFVLPRMKLNLVMFVCNLSQKYTTWNKTQNFVTFLKIYTNIQHLIFSIYNNKNIQLNKWHTYHWLYVFASLFHKRFLSCFAILLQVYTYFTHTQQ